MSDYRVRFQFQQGTMYTCSRQYAENRPCSVAKAKELLDSVGAEAQQDFRNDHVMQQKISGAIDRAKNQVERLAGAGTDRRGGRATIYKDEFDRQGYTFRVEIEIWAGEGHFRERW